MRDTNIGAVHKALPGTKTATVFQMERQLNTPIDLPLASQIPLVQDQH
jgi:hypothetical protein